MIVLNRVSRLLHKDSFLLRQRKAMSYSKRFIVTDQDLLDQLWGSPSLGVTSTKQSKQSRQTRQRRSSMVSSPSRTLKTTVYYMR
mmetsp:Transcript_845/g.1313  ORF Transcript_845/g.1313 Transcript_845/m.1313 type:complete len:85 (+) Transcript_845:331-585(+)